MVKRILSDAILSFIASAIVRALMLLVSVMISRIAGQELFGQFMMIRSSVATLEIYASFSMGTVASKFIAERRDNDKDKLSQDLASIFLIGLVGAVFFTIILLIYADSISKIFFSTDNKNFILMLRTASILLLVSTLSSVLRGFLTGFQTFSEMAKSSIYSTIITLPIIVSLIYFFSVIGAIVGITIFFIVDLYLKLKICLKETFNNALIFTYKNITKSSKEKISFAMPLILTASLNAPILWYSRTLLIKGSSFSEVALFDAAYQWLAIILVITGAVTNISIPLFSRLIGRQNSVLLKKTLMINLVLNFVIAAMIGMIFIYFSELIMSIYGDTFLEGTDILITLVFAAIVLSINNILNVFLISLGKTWMTFYISVLWTIVFLGLVLWSQSLNATELADYFLISYIIVFFINVLVVSYIVNKKNDTKISGLN